MSIVDGRIKRTRCGCALVLVTLLLDHLLELVRLHLTLVVDDKILGRTNSAAAAELFWFPAYLSTC